MILQRGWQAKGNLFSFKFPFRLSMGESKVLYLKRLSMKFDKAVGKSSTEKMSREYRHYSKRSPNCLGMKCLVDALKKFTRQRTMVWDDNFLFHARAEDTTPNQMSLRPSILLLIYFSLKLCAADDGDMDHRDVKYWLWWALSDDLSSHLTNLLLLFISQHAVRLRANDIVLKNLQHENLSHFYVHKISIKRFHHWTVTIESKH